MTVSLKEIDLYEEGPFAHLKITGKLSREDYEFFVPALDRQIETHGKINMLVELIDFTGWSAGAAWEDTKFGMRHFNDLRRLAIIGDKTWEKGMAFFCKVFTTASVRYFDASNREAALAWVTATE